MASASTPEVPGAAASAATVGIDSGGIARTVLGSLAG